MTLPVLSDLQQVLRRLVVEEHDRQRDLARLEDRVRRFEDLERPAYDTWRRLQFGPVLSSLDELYDELRARRLVAQRVMDLVDNNGLRPREALYVATNPQPPGAPDRPTDSEQDEVAARRRAKLDRKRAERKRVTRERRAASQGTQRAPTGSSTAGEAAQAQISRLYRALARRLHPDSPTAIRSLAPGRVRTIWAEVQAAYARRSVDRLLAIAAWVESVTAAGSSESAAGEPTADPAGVGMLTLAERYARLRALARSCGALERRIAHLEGAPAWGFEPTRVRRAFQETVSRALAAELAEARAAVQAVEDFLASIGSPQRPTQRRNR